MFSERDTEQSERLIQLQVQASTRKTRQAMRDYPAAEYIDGVPCCPECLDPLPQARLTLGFTLCVDCQNARERHRASYGDTANGYV